MQKAKQGDTDDLKAALYYAERADLPDLALECHYKLATQNSSLEDALQWLLLMQSSEADSSAIYAGIDDLLKVLPILKISFCCFNTAMVVWKRNCNSS